MGKTGNGEATLYTYYENDISASTLDRVGNTGFGVPAYDFLEMSKYIKKDVSLLEVGSGTGRLGMYFLTLCELRHYTGLEMIHKFTTVFEKKLMIIKNTSSAYAT